MAERIKAVLANPDAWQSLFVDPEAHPEARERDADRSRAWRDRPPSQARRLERARTVFDLHAEGLTRPQIAVATGVSRATVDRALRGFQTQN